MSANTERDSGSSAEEVTAAWKLKPEEHSLVRRCQHWLLCFHIIVPLSPGKAWLYIFAVLFCRHTRKRYVYLQQFTTTYMNMTMSQIQGIVLFLFSGVFNDGVFLARYSVWSIFMGIKLSSSCHWVLCHNLIFVYMFLPSRYINWVPRFFCVHRWIYVVLAWN